MSTTTRMGILLKPPGPDYQSAVVPYRQHMESLVTDMGKVVIENGPLSRVAGFRDYSVYCGWPIRQLEYSFAISHLSVEPHGRVLDIGSGVTPLPYVLAARGWPVTSIDLEIEQVCAMRLHGADTFGSQVEHRVADSRGMGFRDGWFSMITCISVLEHMKHA